MAKTPKIHAQGAHGLPLCNGRSSLFVRTGPDVSVTCRACIRKLPAAGRLAAGDPAQDWRD